MEEDPTNQTSVSGNITLNLDVGVENEMELPWYGRVICVTTMLLIWMVGSTGNFLVIYVVCKEKQLQTPINMFLVNLSVADFITSAIGSPFPFIASVVQRWPFGETACIIYAFGMALGGITSITTLMVLAFERYLMIARPFRAADILISHSSAIICGIWFYSLALTLPPLFGWASYGPEGPYISCSVSWEKDDLTTKTYITFLFVLGLVIPLITITLSYIGIVITIKSASQVQTGTTSATAKAELRVTGMIALMITCFLVAWVPYAIVSLIVSFGGPRERELITPVISVLPSIFAKSSTCYNPVIYVGLNTQFQNAWMKLFGIQRESVEMQTGQTVGAPTSAVPTNAKQEASSISEGDISLKMFHRTDMIPENDMTYSETNVGVERKSDTVDSNLKVTSEELEPYPPVQSSEHQKDKENERMNLIPCRTNTSEEESTLSVVGEEAKANY